MNICILSIIMSDNKNTNFEQYIKTQSQPPMDGWDNRERLLKVLDEKIQFTLVIQSPVANSLPAYCDCNTCGDQSDILSNFFDKSGQPLFFRFAEAVAEYDCKNNCYEKKYVESFLKYCSNELLNIENSELYILRHNTPSDNTYIHYGSFIKVINSSVLNELIGGSGKVTIGRITTWWGKVCNWVTKHRSKFYNDYSEIENESKHIDTYGQRLAELELVLQRLTPIKTIIEFVEANYSNQAFDTVQSIISDNLEKNIQMWKTFRTNFFDDTTPYMQKNRGFIIKRFGFAKGVSKEEEKIKLTHSRAFEISWRSPKNQPHDVYFLMTLYDVNGNNVGELDWHKKKQNFRDMIKLDKDDTNDKEDEEGKTGGPANEIISFDAEALVQNGIVGFTFDVKMYNEPYSTIDINYKFPEDRHGYVRTETFKWAYGVPKQTTFHTLCGNFRDYIIPQEAIQLSECPLKFDFIFNTEVTELKLSTESIPDSKSLNCKNICILMVVKNWYELGLSSRFLAIPLGNDPNKVGGGDFCRINHTWRASCIGTIDGKFHILNQRTLKIPQHILDTFLGRTIFSVPKSSFRMGANNEIGRLRGKHFSIPIVSQFLANMMGVDVARLIQSQSASSLLDNFVLVAV
jgi:hypothetical protein